MLRFSCGTDLWKLLSGLDSEVLSVYTEEEYRGKGICTSLTGDFSWFQGYEEIYCNNVKVYECYFHGGIMK